MRRREFIALLGGAAAAWPLVARAQQRTQPVIGFLSTSSADASRVAAFRQGLAQVGYIEGQNVTIEYRWADDRSERLPSLAADLVDRQVAVIAAPTTPAALAAKAATSTIPIVFTSIGDPVQLHLVASLNRPGGNVTGVTQTNVEITPKRLQLLHELIPTTSVMGLLVNPTNPFVETETKELQAAARSLGLELRVLNASTESDFDGVFAKLVQLQAGGLVITGDALFNTWTEQLAALGLRHAVPTVYQSRKFAVAGGLLSYGTDFTETYRLAGNYTGRVLKGDKPADLPVQQATKVELYINQKTAKALGLTVPQALLSRADDVIE
ncbi:MAG TPA: ABC transporter substrate-binding protein [Pseudolabrys sp.]|jgi:putative ABC transport system substrate-binding protein|nr:ABC transporter substrate-binding protein [Pseudolabrys sp.]